MTQAELLAQDFPSEMIKTTPKDGKRLSYIPVHEVIQRLNDVLGPSKWNWKVTKVWRDELDPDWVLAYGDLTAEVDGEVSTKGGSGGLKIKRKNSNNATDPNGIVDLGDEFKGAESDALKKAAQRFGIGLYLSRSPEAIAYEAPVASRDAVAEGWESYERARTHCDELKIELRELPDESKAEARYEMDRLQIEWPPTLHQYNELRSWLVGHRQTAQIPSGGSQEVQPVQQSTEDSREAAAKLEAAFPGSETTTLASKDEIDAVAKLLATVTSGDGGVANKRAWSKFRKEKNYPDDLREMSSEQAFAAMDFLEML